MSASDTKTEPAIPVGEPASDARREPPPLREGWFWQWDDHHRSWGAKHIEEGDCYTTPFLSTMRMAGVLCTSSSADDEWHIAPADVVLAVIRANDPSIDAVFAERDQMRADLADAAGDLPISLPEPGTVAAKLLSANVLLRRENERLRRDLTNAEGDARILAHAYEHDSRPPPAVVERALAYQAGRPAAPGGPTT